MNEPEPVPLADERDRQALQKALRRAMDDFSAPRGSPAPRTIAENLTNDLEPLRAPDAAADPLCTAWRPIAESGDWFAVEPPPRRWLLRGRDDDRTPVMPRGIVAMLAGAGGAGKGHLTIQLAISVATGRPWLDTFAIEEPGRVVILQAEDDVMELRRRIYRLGRALELTRDEERDAADRIVPIGIPGELVSLVEMGPDGVRPTNMHARILERLGRSEHALVILDPLARWAPGCETDQALATGTIQLVEQFARAAGAPTALVSHHTSQRARLDTDTDGGDVTDARGVTALTDACRYVWPMRLRAGGRIRLASPKNNYAPPMEPIDLVRDRSGLIRPPTSLELDESKARAERAARELLDRLRRARSPPANSEELRNLVGGRGADRAAAVALAKARGWITPRGPYRATSEAPTGVEVST